MTLSGWTKVPLKEVISLNPDDLIEIKLLSFFLLSSYAMYVVISMYILGSVQVNLYWQHLWIEIINSFVIKYI